MGRDLRQMISFLLWRGITWGILWLLPARPLRQRRLATQRWCPHRSLRSSILLFRKYGFRLRYATVWVSIQSHTWLSFPTIPHQRHHESESLEDEPRYYLHTCESKDGWADRQSILYSYAPPSTWTSPPPSSSIRHPSTSQLNSQPTTLYTLGRTFLPRSICNDTLRKPHLQRLPMHLWRYRNPARDSRPPEPALLRNRHPCEARIPIIFDSC